VKIGGMIATINKTAARKKGSLARTNVSANRTIAAKVMKLKVIRKLKPTLELASQTSKIHPAIGEKQ
jgi:hypothetical protein